jgi:hypothetical protein
MGRIGIEDGQSWIWPFLLLSLVFFPFFVFVKINHLKNLIFLKYVKQKESNIKSNELVDSFWKKVVR